MPTRTPARAIQATQRLPGMPTSRRAGLEKASRVRERDLQTQILKLLHARGVVAWPMNREAGVRRALGNARTTARIGGPGFADIVGILPIRVVRRQIGMMGTNDELVNGRFLAIECKAPKARTAKRRALAQAAFGATVIRPFVTTLTQRTGTRTKFEISTTPDTQKQTVDVLITFR